MNGSKIKIIYCIEGTYNSGGMERIIIQKANYLVKLGYEMIIVTSNQRGRKPFFSIDNRIKQIDLGLNYDLIDRYCIIKKFFHYKSIIRKHKKELLNVITHEKPDIVISTFGKEIEFIDKLKCKKIFITIGEIHFSHNYRLMNLHKKSLRYCINKYLISKYDLKASKLDAFVCLTKEDQKYWRDQTNLYVIPNFIEKRSIEPASLETKQVIALGRLCYQKGYDRLIHAWKIVSLKHPDWKLTIFGDGPLKDNLIKLTSELGISDSISFQRPTKNVYDNLQKSSIYVMSSRFEGMPMVLIEAMACGLPIVSYSCKCGPKDLLESKDNGILVDEGNIEGLANGLLKYIEDKNLRISHGKHSYEESNKYSINCIMPMWIELFSKLISNK